LHVSPLRRKTAPDFLVQSTVASAEGGNGTRPTATIATTMAAFIASSIPPRRHGDQFLLSGLRVERSLSLDRRRRDGSCVAPSPRRMVNNLPSLFTSARA